MQKVFADTRTLDAAARKKYSITEEVMMENAASALEKEVLDFLAGCSTPKPVVLIVTGTGNNGGDGYALARRLCGKTLSDGRKINVCIFAPKPPKTEIAVFQKETAVKTGVSFVNTLENTNPDVLVDCFLGSGLSGKLTQDAENLIKRLNEIQAFKVACDVPSGLSAESDTFFIADKTVTMGALKTQLFCENGKDSAGTVVCADLGISRDCFELSDSAVQPEAYLLEKADLHLPHREKNNVNKGTFGHLAVFGGEKRGAAVIASKAAFAFGTGLVTIVDNADNGGFAVPEDILCSNTVPSKISAVAAGMGLGTFCDTAISYLCANPNVPCVIDADLCHSAKLPELLLARKNPANTVLTPHPKEFADVLEICGLGKYTVEQVQQNRIGLAGEFCDKYPDSVLILKGAVPVIAAFNDGAPVAYLNPWGRPCLAKGGSGDVLSGLVGALLAQGYDALKAAQSASLAHALASCKVECDYAMTPFELIECVKKL